MPAGERPEQLRVFLATESPNLDNAVDRDETETLAHRHSPRLHHAPCSCSHERIFRTTAYSRTLVEEESR
jgi:hypothetical protein